MINKIWIKFILILLMFLNIINLVNCDISNKEVKKLELDEKVTGKMDSDDSHEYYSLKIPKSFEKGNLLVFTVKESRQGIKEGDEIFSDPDIYISKSNKFPSNKEEADWYSERYGSDILTIPSYAVGPEDEFFIGMYCQYKCRYELQSYVQKETQIDIGKVYHFNLNKKEALSYALYVPKNEKNEELNIVASNPSFQNFKIFVAKESPSSQNTFLVIPSWVGGYVISVDKSNKNYCTDCTYHILLLTAEEDVSVQFFSYFQSTITEIKSGVPVNDAVKSSNKRCYSYEIQNFRNLDESKLLIQSSLYSGSVMINFSGWNKRSNIEMKDIKKDKYTYQVETNKIIMLQKEDFDYFNTNSENHYGEDENYKKKLNFCIYGQQMTSYRLLVYFLSEAQGLQRYNSISPGSEMIGYLQGGQVTRYRILDYNLNKNSEINLNFEFIQGQSSFYSSFCTGSCYFNARNLKNKIEANELKPAEQTSYSTSKLTIKPEENKCYLEGERKCTINTVIKCNGSQNDICAFKIVFNSKEQPLLMAPKKTYYNIIPKGKTDLYEIMVNDQKFNSIVIVLTSLTGDAELTVMKKKVSEAEGGYDEEKLIGMSKNRDYIPDVVRITPSKLGKENVTGKYIIKVEASSFSSYNLYYYTTRTKEKYEQPNLNDITSSLTEGRIISDYFPNDLAYKVYSYTPDNRNKKDIKIILTRLNVHFSFKVYLDFDKIKYNYEAKTAYEERLKNYLWSSDLNNELTISKDDKNYSEKGPYYIVVTKEQTKEDNALNELDTHAVMMFYIGVTKKGIPFSLYEGIEQSETLTEKYNYQNYWYIHKDINEPFQLQVNVLNGEVDVFIDLKELTEENITSLYKSLEEDKRFFRNSIYSKRGISSYGSIELYKDYFEENKYRNNFQGNYYNQSTSFFIYVVQSRASIKFQKDSQYIITAKSSISKGKFLVSGQVYTTKLKLNNIDHYIIDEIKHRKGSTINIKFLKGNADVYVRIPDTPEIGKNIDFPSPGLFDYKGSDSYLGKIVSIPAKVFDKINSKSLKLQILISIYPTSVLRQEVDYIEYSISYSSEAKRISQNKPYQSYITAGEYQFYTFYFDAKTENIFISLSNMNGDADMYLNYGNEVYPSPDKYDWFSSNSGHEYIDINKNNEVIKKKQMKNLSGYYTLLVVGYIETTYTLFISSHDDNIFPLNDNIPVSCKCQKKDDKCYFRYDDVFPKEYQEEIKREKNEIIFTTQYLYGNGKMYATLYKDQDLTSDSNKKYQEFFPNEKNFQFSNSETGKRNYMKITTDEQTITKDSLILMTFLCKEKTDVEITAASLSYDGVFRHIDIDRENIYYLKRNTSVSINEQRKSLLTFFSRKDEDLIYEFHAYTGNAHIKVYTNESVWDLDSSTYRFDYNHLAEFYLNSDSDSENKITRYFKSYSDNYYNSISKSLSFNKLIYFEITPQTDFGFYIQTLYDRSWINVPIGKEKSYLINKNEMYGYFDIYEDFSSIEINLSLEDYSKKIAKIYVKLIVVSKNIKDINSNNIEDKLYHYEIPNEDNNDYEAKTNNYLGTISISLLNLPELSEKDKESKIIRALFSIKISKIRGNNMPSSSENTLSSSRKESTVHLTISPGVNNFKRIDLAQNTYFLSNTSLIAKSKGYNDYQNFDDYGINKYSTKSYDGSKEVKIYGLDKRNDQDKIMVIQISKCEGNYELKTSSKIVDYDNNDDDILITNKKTLLGRNIFIIEELKHKHIYLSIKSSKNQMICQPDIETDSKNNNCTKELSYLLYYYSLTPEEYKLKMKDIKLEYRQISHNQLLLIIPSLQGRNSKKKKFRGKENIEYNLFWTKNETYVKNIESICYLSQMLNDMNYNETTEFHILRNINLTDRQEYIINGITPYSPVYINVLARNLKTDELFAYVPIEGSIVGKGTARFFFYTIVIVIFLIAAYYGYKYYKDKLSNIDIFPFNKQTEISSSGTGGYKAVNLQNY